MSARAFFAAMADIAERIEQTQRETIELVAGWMADTIASERLVHLFGAGHSAIVVQEMFPRIGSINGFNPLTELPLTYYTPPVGDLSHRANLFLSTVEEYGSVIMRNYEFDPGDMFLCCTATGINAVTVEVALEAKRQGLRTVALTSMAHSLASEARHSSGRRLFEACDVTIDLCTPAGDAVVDLGLEDRVGGSSSIAACLIGNALVAQTAANLAERGVEFDVMPSVFYAGESTAQKRERAAAVFERMWKDYRRRTRRL